MEEGISMDSAATEITFDDVVEKSNTVAEFNVNARKYLEQHKELNSEERRKHYWALFYKWKEKKE